MARTLQELNDEVGSYLNRRDYQSVFPGWVQAVETEMAETMRSKFQLEAGYQDIIAPQITLPPDFASMESIVDDTTGVNFELKDTWTGSRYAPQQDDITYNAQPAWINTLPIASYAYRVIGTCIEFLPWPKIPNPPDPTWQAQRVFMRWYARPTPLLLPSDTNAILLNFPETYLYGVLKRGAIWALDDERAAQMDAQYQQVVTRANTWTQQSQYSGAPMREEMAAHF